MSGDQESSHSPQVETVSTEVPPKTSTFGRLKERLLGRAPSEQAMEAGRGLAAARLEGDELMSLAMLRLSGEQQAAAELDEVAAGIQAKKGLVESETGMQSLIADFVAGRGTINIKQEAQIRESVINGRVDTAQLALQILDEERTAAAKEIALLEARGKLPDEPWQREMDLAARLEESEARQLAAGSEVVAALQKALAEGGLTREVFQDTRGLARTMVRAEGVANRTLGRLQDRLGRRFPDQAVAFGEHAKGFSDRKAKEDAAIVLPEAEPHVVDYLGQRAIELVAAYGVKDPEVQARALKELGVTNDSEGAVMVREGSLAARLFATESHNTALKTALESAVAAASENPRLATKALEAAHLSFQAQQAERAMRAKAERIGIRAVAQEQDSLEQKLRVAESQQASMERRANVSAWLDGKWKKAEAVAAGLSERTTSLAIRAESRLKRAYNSARKTTLGSALSVQTLAKNLGTSVEDRIGAVAPRSERQEAVVAEIAQLEARLAELRGEQATTLPIATVAD